MCEPNCSDAEQRILCGLCPSDAALKFIQLPDFLMHLDELHRPLKLYACHYCSRAYSSKGNLLCHDCPSFQDFVDAKGLMGCKDCNFAYQFRSLICSRCGLQVGINDNIDGIELSSFLAQFHRCMELHEPSSFVHCVVCMLEVSPTDMVMLSFLTNDKSLQCCSKEMFLPAYIAAASQTKDVVKSNITRDRIADTFNGEENLPRVKKGLTHSTFFSKIRLENGTEEYECKMCKSRTIPDPRPVVLVQHIRDFHYSKIISQSNDNSHPRTAFNAQVQFRRIELGDGNCQYQCKICGHLTKHNVKANALSQHFNDRHPEMRLVTSETWVGRYLKRYGHLFKETDENDNEQEPIVAVDKDASGINDFTRGFMECKSQLRIYFPSFQFFQSDAPSGLELLDVNVYACEQCDTICAGKLSAAAHFEESHRIHPKSKFNVDDKNHFISLMCADRGKPAVRCLLCETSHCSIMGLKLHLLRAHEIDFTIRGKEEGEELYVHEEKSPLSNYSASSAPFPGAMIKEEFDSENFPIDEMDINNSNDSFNSKLQQILQNANNEIERSESDEFSLGNVAVTSNSSAHEHFDEASTSTANKPVDGNSLEEEMSENNDDKDGICDQEPSVPAVSVADDELQDMSGPQYGAFSVTARAKKMKIRRFNAQKQFIMVHSPEGLRYKCKICDHITKPSVSANTLSQHFSYRHPEMRANATGSSSFVRRKRPLNAQKDTLLSEPSLEIFHSSSSSSASIVPSKRKGNNPYGYNGRQVNPNKITKLTPGMTSTGTSMSEDDIVFGKFLQSISMDEFDRLERSQNTVFPYFEIAVKANPRLSYELIGAFSILYVANIDYAKRCAKISTFFGEFLKKCRSNGTDVLRSVDKQLSAHEFSPNGLLAIADDLLKEKGL